MTPKKHRVGLLGAGYIVDAHVKALRALPQVELAAVCDVSKSRAEAAATEHGIAQSFPSLAEILREAAIPLRPGVLDLMQQCREWGVRMCIATTTSRPNVDALLRLKAPQRVARLRGLPVEEILGIEPKEPKPEAPAPAEA